MRNDRSRMNIGNNSGSVGYSKEALEKLNAGLYQGRKQKYRTSKEQAESVSKKVPALEGMTRSPSFDQTGHVDTANARAKYEQRINHKPIGRGLSSEDAETLYKVFDRNRLSSGGNKAIAHQLRNNIWVNTSDWENKYGKSIEQIVDDYSKDYEKIAARKNVEQGKGNKVSTTLGNIFRGGTVEPALDLESTILGKIAPNNELTKAVRNASEKYAKQKAQTAEGVTSDMGNAGKQVYNFATGLAEKGLQYATPSKLKYALTLGKTAENERQNLKERGIEGTSAELQSGLAGLTDAALDVIGFESIPALKGLAQSGNLGKEILGRFLIGGGEQGLTELINKSADRGFNGQNSLHGIRVQDYINQGMSVEDAERQANVDDALEVGQSVVSGGLLNNALGLGGKAISKALNSVPTLSRNKAEQMTDDLTIARRQAQEGKYGVKHFDKLVDTDARKVLDKRGKLTNVLESNPNIKRSYNGMPKPAELIASDMDNLKMQMDDYAHGRMRENDLFDCGTTPDVLKDNGVLGNKIMMSQKVYDKISLPKGFVKNDKNVNYHGLDTDGVIKIVNGLNDPALTMTSDDGKSVLAVVNYTSKGGTPVLVPIFIGKNGTIEHIGDADSSARITSAHIRGNLDTYIEKRADQVTYIKGDDDSASNGLWSAALKSSSPNPNIPTNPENVNSAPVKTLAESVRRPIKTVSLDSLNKEINDLSKAIEDKYVEYKNVPKTKKRKVWSEYEELKKTKAEKQYELRNAVRSNSGLAEIPKRSADAIDEFKADIWTAGKMFGGKDGRKLAKTAADALDRFEKSGSQEDLKDFIQATIALKNGSTETYTNKNGQTSTYLTKFSKETGSDLVDRIMPSPAGQKPSSMWTALGDILKKAEAPEETIPSDAVYNPETGEYELLENSGLGGMKDDSDFVREEAVEPGEGFKKEGYSQVATNSLVSSNIINPEDIDNDPILNEMAKYARKSNDATYQAAEKNVKENGAALLDDYINDRRQMDNDQDVDQAMIILQNLTDRMSRGEDVSAEKYAMMDRLIKAGRQYGRFIQAFAKWNDTADGLIINGEKILQEPVEAWKSTNQKAVKGNNRIARALEDMGNKWKQAAERPELTHDQIRNGVIKELEKEFGSVDQLFNANDIEYLTTLAENKDIPVWVITSEIEHKLNTGDWYTLDESLSVPQPTNKKLTAALNSLVAETREPSEPTTFDQIREEVKNTLSKEMANVDDFTDEDIDFISNLINNGATRSEIADAMNTRMATGRFGISQDTQNKVNLLFEEANHYDPNSKEAIEAKSAAYKLIADEVMQNASPLEKFEAWRYLAMLGNPKTMIRNYVGNKVFSAVTGISNNLSAALETGTDRALKAMGKEGIQRTKAFLNPTADKGLIDAAARDGEAHRYSQLEGTKYEKGTQDAIKRSKSVFNSKLVQLYEKAVDKGISDYNAVKKKYSTSLAGYMKANGLDESAFDADNTYMGLRDLSRKRLLSDAERSQMKSLKNVHDAMEKARDYAVKQAEYATFHEDNAVAQFLTQQSQKARNSDNPAVRGLGYMVEGLVPFKKTPANILRSGVEYSPLGAIDSIRKTGKLIYENTGARKGNLEDTYTKKSRLSGRESEVNKTLAADVLDSWSKSLTGTGLVALGYYLKNKGILNSSEKDEKYQDDLEGIQNYSITINGKTYTIDWAAPAVMPMLVGAEISKIAERSGIPDEKWYGNVDEVMETVNALLDPITETSMLQGVKNTLESAANEVKYNNASPGGIIGSMGTAMGTSYLTQALPTISGQIARTVDPLRRTTDTASDSNFLSGIERQGRKLMNKVPGLSFMNEAYRDAYGRTQSNSPFDNALGNLLYQMGSPAYIRDINKTTPDKSARKAYEGSKDSKAFATWKSKVTVDGQKLDPKEMATYREKSGQVNYAIRDALAKEDWFNQLSGDKQTDILNNVNTLVDKIGKEAAGYPQDNKDLQIYNEGGIPALLDKYQDKQINKQIEEQTGLKSTSKAAKEIKAEIKAGNTQAAQQKIEEGRQQAENQNTAKSLGLEAKTYNKIADKAKGNADKVYNAVPELKRAGLGAASAYYQYADALSVDPSLSSGEFIDTFNAVDTDNSKGIKQDELIDYFNKNKYSQQQANRMWQMYGDSKWKKVPALVNGTFVKK